MMGARILPATVVGLILLFLVLPIVVVMVVSFSSATYLTFPPPAFGLKWYEAYFSSADWLQADLAQHLGRGRRRRAVDGAGHAGRARHRPPAQARCASWWRAWCSRR